MIPVYDAKSSTKHFLNIYFVTKSAFSKAHLILMKIVIIPFIPDVETQIQKGSITCPRI